MSYDIRPMNPWDSAVRGAVGSPGRAREAGEPPYPGLMPRVTQSYRDRQAARILAAAEICFARRGFDGASMDDIITETGMSSSTVYRYFPEGKRPLVRAVLSQTTDPVVEWIEELAGADELPTLEDAFAGAVERSWILKRGGSDEEDATAARPGKACRSGRSSGSQSSGCHLSQAGRIELMVSVWAELARQPDLREANAKRYARVRSEIVGLIRRWQNKGIIARRIDPDEAAAIVHNAAMGLVAERIVTGEFGRTDAVTTARAIARLLGA